MPDALALSCGKDDVAFDGLLAHQRHGWAMFLFQVAGLALLRAGRGAPEFDEGWAALADPTAWREWLAALTPGCADKAWSLVVEDLAKPALLQPPIGRGSLDDYKLIGRMPDEIDVLVTSKGHDVKPARAAGRDPVLWLYALVTLQTMQGYSGRGNFGIARMNGGFGSRPLVMASTGQGWTAQFRRGVQAALAARREALRDGGLFAADGVGLLWLVPWDDEKSLSLSRLDPLFIEVCRRVRLRWGADKTGAGMEAWGRPSEVARVAAKDQKGVLADAWMPVHDGDALTVGRTGFDYRMMSRLLANDRPEAMKWPPGHTGDVMLQAAVLSRGKGETGGFHERWLCIPAQVFAAGVDTLGRLSVQMVADSGRARDALGGALRIYLQGAPAKTAKDERPREWLERFDGAVDRMFFTHLFRRAAEPPDQDVLETAEERAWRDALRTLTRRVLDAALARLDPPGARRDRAEAFAALTFDSMMRKAGLAWVAEVPDGVEEGDGDER